MSRQRKWVACGIGFAAIACGLVACKSMLATDAYNDLQIKQVQVLSGGDCTVPGTPTALMRHKGVLDLALPDGSTPPYYLPVVVLNNLSSVGGSTADEMNNIDLQHFEINLSAPGVNWDGCPPTKFSTEDFTDRIAPGGSVGESFNVLTAAHSQCLQPQVPPEELVVTASIKAIGRHGGTSIESAPFLYTIVLCRGCLQTGYTDPALVTYQYDADYPACASLLGSNPYPGDPCLPPGQDKMIFCCGSTRVVDKVAQNVVLCPGVFTGTTATSTSTSTSTTTATSP